MNRRDFIRASTAGLAAATIPAAGCRRGSDNTASRGTARKPALGDAADLQGLVGDGRQRRILLRGGVVLSLDQRWGLRKGRRPDRREEDCRDRANVSAGDAEVVDCTGTIVMPGFITTHHHQYETLQRSVIPTAAARALAAGELRVGRPEHLDRRPHRRSANPNNVIWDLGRVPYDPEDCYISELVACLSEISEGITTGTDTSQSGHTPEHTDAMIKGLMDSGRRMVFAYTGGINRSSEGIPVRDSRAR
jgi:hypothetical protein